MTTPGLQGRCCHIYALFTGIGGVLVLMALCTHQTPLLDLAALLLFAVLSLLVSYFKIPIGQAATGPQPNSSLLLRDVRRATLGLDGVVILGATLVGGAAFGGWAAFITGLTAPIVQRHALDAEDGVSFRPPSPPSGQQTGRRRIGYLLKQLRSRIAPWVEPAASGMFNGGRNVIAVALAWFAYIGMGGRIRPGTIDASQAMALIMLCVVYTTVRTLLAWPVIALFNASFRQALSNLVDPIAFSAELVPLPVALLVAATFVHLGWPYLVLLALIFIGFGAVARRMLRAIRATNERNQALLFTRHVQEAIHGTAPEVADLCALAYSLCSEAAPAARFELGLYDPASGCVHLQVAVDGAFSLPSMRIPLTPLWTWLGERQKPVLMNSEAHLATLPFTLPPLGQRQSPQAALFVPLLCSGQQEEEQKQAWSSLDLDAAPVALFTSRPAGTPLGGIVLQAEHPGAFSRWSCTQVTIIAKQIALAIENIQPSHGRVQGISSPEAHPQDGRSDGSRHN